MGCCSGDDDNKKVGMATKRKCRDVLCLLLFIAFWIGMGVIGVWSFKNGDPDRLIYGIDSYGLSCGKKYELGGSTIDLRERKNLYYLNPLDLLSISNIKYAKKVCVNGCPGQDQFCGIEDLPCSNADQFVCPYYRFAGAPIYPNLSNSTDSAETQYYKNLSSLPPSFDIPGASAAVNALQTTVSVPWVEISLNVTGINTTGPWDGTYYQLTSQIPGKGPCYVVLTATVKYINRCFPKFPSEFTDAIVEAVDNISSKVPPDVVDFFTKEWSSISNRISRYVMDISKGILIIVVGGLIAGVMLSIIWLILLRYLAGVFAWLTIILINLLLIAMALYCFSLAGMLGSNTIAEDLTKKLPGALDPTRVDQKIWMWIAIVVAVIAGLVLIFTLLMISRIRIAIAVIKVASQACGAMPSIFLFPFLPFFFEVGLVVYWVAVAAMMYTSGDLNSHCRSEDSHDFFSFSDFANFIPAPQGNNSKPVDAAACYSNMTREDKVIMCGDDPNCFLTYDWNNDIKYAFIYHFFGLLWTSQVIVGFSCVTIAGAIASFYWAGGDQAKMPTFPVLAALKNTLVYHMGSVCFGALLMAILLFIRAVLEYIDHKTKGLQDTSCCLKWLLCCCKCCFWCIQKIVEYINRNAYIMVAVKGSNYCVSAARAVLLIVTNALRLLAVNIIGDVLIGLAKLTIAVACGFIAFALTGIPYYVDEVQYPETYMSNPVLVIIICVIVGFTIAEVFFAVYEMAIDTIILSFCEDCDSNGGDPKFAPPLLMEVMGCQPAGHKGV